MWELIIYFSLSIIVSVAAVLVPLVARMAMKKGLTYSAMNTVVWTLIILAIARVWHTVVDITKLKNTMGETAEAIEYVIYIIAYIVFIWLIYRSIQTKSPESSK